MDLFRVVLHPLPEPPDVLDRWLDLVTNRLVLGRPTHDARIAAVVHAHGVRDLISLNESHFRRYSNLFRCRTPATFLKDWDAANKTGNG